MAIIMLDRSYKALKKQVYADGQYRLVPIQDKDKYDIMRWRNEQIYHLRQPRPLTKEDQEQYFSKVIRQLFVEEKPNQLLFSYLKDGECIGYGGLVHIDWESRHAEVSFIMKTELETSGFGFHWSQYLTLLQQIAFGDLKFRKVFTYAFDLRPQLYPVLEKNGFALEGRLRDHVLYDGRFFDVLIHAKYNGRLDFRPAQLSDLELTYQWATDERVRKYAINTSEINFENHSKWFERKMNAPDTRYYIVEHAGVPVGSFGLDIFENTGVISYLLDPSMHGKGFGSKMLSDAIAKFKNENLVGALRGQVFLENVASMKIFERLGFTRLSEDEQGLVLFEKVLK